MRTICRNSEWWWIPRACILPSGNRHNLFKSSKEDQMDLTLNDEQRMLRESADRFVTETYNADYRRRQASDPRGFSTDIWKQFADLGWLALPIREDHGGLGGGAIEIGILMEAFGRGLVSEPYLSTVVIGASLIAERGSELQKQALLPHIA